MEIKKNIVVILDPSSDIHRELIWEFESNIGDRYQTLTKWIEYRRGYDKNDIKLPEGERILEQQQRKRDRELKASAYTNSYMLLGIVEGDVKILAISSMEETIEGTLEIYNTTRKGIAYNQNLWKEIGEMTLKNLKVAKEKYSKVTVFTNFDETQSFELKTDITPGELKYPRYIDIRDDKSDKSGKKR